MENVCEVAAKAHHYETHCRSTSFHGNAEAKAHSYFFDVNDKQTVSRQRLTAFKKKTRRRGGKGSS